VVAVAVMLLGAVGILLVVFDLSLGGLWLHSRKMIYDGASFECSRDTFIPIKPYRLYSMTGQVDRNRPTRLPIRLCLPEDGVDALALTADELLARGFERGPGDGELTRHFANGSVAITLGNGNPSYWVNCSLFPVASADVFAVEIDGRVMDWPITSRQLREFAGKPAEVRSSRAIHIDL